MADKKLTDMIEGIIDTYTDKYKMLNNSLDEIKKGMDTINESLEFESEQFNKCVKLADDLYSNVDKLKKNVDYLKENLSDTSSLKTNLYSILDTDKLIRNQITQLRQEHKLFTKDANDKLKNIQEAYLLYSPDGTVN